MDNKTLSPSDARKAEKYIRRLERESRWWPIARWVLLCFSLLIVAAAISNMFRLQEIFETFSSLFALRTETIDPEEIELFVNWRIRGFQAEQALFYRILLHLIIGTFMFFYSIANWNKHIKSALMAKALRRLVIEDQSKQGGRSLEGKPPER